jgi:hypothetical protein
MEVNMDKALDPAGMPDGMQISHEGTVYTAFPAPSWMPSWMPAFRWQGDNGTFLTDLAIRELLLDGATVLGVNQEEIDKYNAIIKSVRERNGE